MSLEEKTGQMVQITMSAFTLPHSPQLDTAAVRRIFGQYRIGSVLNTFADTARTRDLTAENVRILQGIALEEIGIPILYGLDMIHGASYISDATLFPQEIAVAATFDRQFARKMGEATAYETRAAMVPWIFAPTMDLGRDPRWPRMWESWGEDAFLSSEMAVSAVRGLQGDDPDHIDSLHVGACVKHYLAYGVPTSGKDRTPARVPEPELREKYFQPFRASLCSGAVSLMVNSGAVNGMPVHASRTWLTQWTKEELSWDGLIVTDWADLDNLWQRDHVAADEDEALCMGINAGVDLVMEPYDPAVAERIAALVRAGRIPAARVDDAVRRILRLKFRLGLFDPVSLRSESRHDILLVKDLRFSLKVDVEIGEDIRIRRVRLKRRFPYEQAVVCSRYELRREAGDRRAVRAVFLRHQLRKCLERLFRHAGIRRDFPAAEERGVLRDIGRRLLRKSGSRHSCSHRHRKKDSKHRFFHKTPPRIYPTTQVKPNKSVFMIYENHHA